MKKIIALALSALMLFGILTGCSASENGGGKNTFNLTTVKEGYLTVATSPDYAPFEFYALDKDGNPTLAGFDMDLAQYIADYLGLTLEIVPMDFDGTILELGNKKCDLGMAGYSADPDRLIYMDFTDVYYTSEQTLVTTADKKDIITSTEIANNPDYKIGVQTGSIQAELAHEFTPNADIVELSKVTDIIMELSTGKLDAAFIETPVVQAYANTYKNLHVACVIPQDDNGSVIGVYKGNADLLKYVNEAINKAIADGTFAQYVAKAVDLAAGDTHQGLLDENGKVPTTSGN
jgi:polar amino acid transport system substrate-binding protein